MAAAAFDKMPQGNTAPGTHVMVAGVLFQLASLVVFSVLFTCVITKTLRSNCEKLQDKRVRWIIEAVVFSVAVIVTRTVYRAIELLQGWRGYLITTERYFIALDGTMMVLAVGVFNLAQPS